MDTCWLVAGVMGVALLFGWDITNAVEVSVPGGADDQESFDFDIPAQPLRSAAEAFAKCIGRDTYIGHETFQTCGNFMVEPVVGRFTATEAWRRLTAPICAPSGVVIERPGDAPVYMVDHPWVAEREITIARAPLVDALDALRRQFPGLLLEYRSRDPEEGRRLVGPIEGTLNPEDALRRIEKHIGPALRHRSSGTYAFLLESSTAKDAPYLRYRYARQCACPVNVEGVAGETVTVVDSALRQRKSGGVETYTRKQIESTGAVTLPQFLRYLAQNGTSRPEGYVASGAQYADFRGLGWDTHLVTINGRRALPSANSLTSSAFDLNTIPLPAVDHVDIRHDAASVRSGSDAIAGTIDIVTRRELDAAMELRYGSASGGAEERRTTLSVGHQGSTAGFAALFDYFELGDLLGAERPLSRDQNYARYGGTDFRRPLAIRSTDGMNLPGLSTPLAGMPDRRASDQLSIAELMPGEPQRVSLSRYRSLVPASQRLSFVGSADYAWRGLKFAADALWVKRDTAYDYFPAIAGGEVSQDLPGNPFDAPVQIEALLTGAPSMQQHVDSELRRLGLSARGSHRAWHWDLAVINSDESAVAWVDHMLDPGRTAQALMATDEESALDVFAMQPGRDAPAAIWADVRKQRFSSSGVNVFGGIEGPIGPARVQLGGERRTEAMQFNAAVGQVERDVTGAFAHLTLPLVAPDRKMFGVNALTAFAGVRHDAFSDAGSVTRTHAELRWNVTDRFVVDGNLAQQYRPPSLFELNLPTVAVPVPIYDPRREEAVTAMILSGGNPALRPTTGKSTNIQATYESLDGVIASINYFSIRLWDRIAVLSIPVVLAAEEALPGRIVRAPTPEEIVAGRPGRITALDTTRANVGRLFTRGVDVSVHKTFDAAIGSLTPRLDVTWIDAFRYSDSPLASAVMTDRVGMAAEQGTITPWRAVASLEWQGQAWAAMTYLRWIPGYQDVGGGYIDSQQLWDLNVSYRPSDHLTFTLGAMDLADTSPPFSKVGAATGYDSSQWEPVGRRVMLTARVSL